MAVRSKPHAGLCWVFQFDWYKGVLRDTHWRTIWATEESASLSSADVVSGGEPFWTFVRGKVWGWDAGKMPWQQDVNWRVYWKLGICGWLTSLGTLWYWGFLFLTLLEWWEAEATPWLCPTLIWDLKLWPLAAQLLRRKLFSKFLLVQSSCHHSSPQVFSYVLNGYSKVKQWKGGRREAIYKMDYQKLDEGPKACLIWTE